MLKLESLQDKIDVASPLSWVVAGFFRFGVAAGWGFGRAAGAGLAGVCCHPALPLAGFGAAGAFAVAGPPALGTGVGPGGDGVARGLGGGVPDGRVVVEVDEVVVVV